MPLPTPEPGLVLRYSYLWLHDSVKGKIEGVKDRPCAIVLSTENSDDNSVVSVVPVTHTEPSNLNEAIEIPAIVRARLGLDGEKSWVILSERNRFIWPGPDIRSINHENNDEYDYGFLPPAFYDELKAKLLALIKEQRVSLVERTE